MSDPRSGRRRLAAGIALGLVLALAVTACSKLPRVHLSGTSDEVEDWRVGIPF